MPQIAQQDYIVIAPIVANDIVSDAAALGRLAAILEKKDLTIFDVILDLSGDGEDLEKIVARFYRRVAYISAEDSSVGEMNITNTAVQYEGLAAIQATKNGPKDVAPAIFVETDYNNMIYEGSTGRYICTLDGYKVQAQVGADKRILELEKSSELAGDLDTQILVPFEEIEKLVGLPFSEH